MNKGNFPARNTGNQSRNTRPNQTNNQNSGRNNYNRNDRRNNNPNNYPISNNQTSISRSNDSNNSHNRKNTTDSVASVVSKINPIGEVVSKKILSEQFSIMTKPEEKCSLGQPIPLTTNHYDFKINKEFTIFHYDLQFRKKNEKNETAVNKEIAMEFFNQVYHKSTSMQNKVFYDLKKNLYSLFEIESNQLEKNFETKIKGKASSFIVELKKVAEIEFKNDSVIDVNMLKILQLAITFYFRMNFLSLNPQKFFKLDCEKKQLGFDKWKNQDTWKGFFVSLRPSENGLTLNLNLFHSVFTRQTNLIDLACLYFKCEKEDLGTNINNSDSRNHKPTKEGFVKLLKYFKISPIYREYKSKKRARGLGNSAQQEIISQSKINLVQYFKDTYNQDIEYPYLPCVDFGNRVLIPLELCETVVENKSNLDKQLQATFIRETAIDSIQRFESLNELRKTLNFDDFPLLNEINLSIDNRMINLTGRKLDSIEIEYGKSEIIVIDKGRWDNQGKIFYKPENVLKWVAYSFCYENKLNRNLFDEFIKKLISQAKDHGINLPNPEKVEIKQPFPEFENTAYYYDFLDSEIKKIKPSFILAILPDQSPVYGALKTIGDLVYGIPNQSINFNNLCSKEQDFKKKIKEKQLISNIMLKINAKLGGTNFIINQKNKLYEEYLKKILEEDVMVFGIDVNKPSPTDKSSKINNKRNSTDVDNSMAAITGSIDKNWTYYAARMVAQRKNKKDSLEYINDLKYPVKELLEEYKKANNAFPKRLLIFRDGISEGEFENILNHEMNEIRAACSDICTDYKPPVTFVVVQKRHQTRFFTKKENLIQVVGKTFNIPPGTMVDVKVITPNRFNYFLSSHLGIQGTTKPCHYYILHDENEFKVNAIILLSHYLCHIYARSTTAVSYPAPTYYADHCAERAREYLTDKIPIRYYPKSSFLVDSYPIETHETLKNKMFYI